MLCDRQVRLTPNKFYCAGVQLVLAIFGKIVENIYKAFAIRYDGRYLLYIDGTVFLFDYNTKMFKNVAANLGDTTADKTVNWFVWDFSGIYGSIFGGFDFEGKAMLMSISNIATDNGTKRIVLQLRLGGESDVTHIVDEDNAVIADYQQDICGYIATKMMNFGSDCRKNIVKLDFRIDANEKDVSKAKLFLCTENGKKQLKVSGTGVDKSGKICLLPLCNNVRKMKLEIETIGAAVIGGFNVTYKQM